MKAFVGQDVYDFIFNREEAELLAGSSLETDLIDTDTQMSTGKRIRLQFREPEFGDAELNLEPAGASWNQSTAINITMKRRYLDSAKREGHSSAIAKDISSLPFVCLLLHQEQCS